MHRASNRDLIITTLSVIFIWIKTLPLFDKIGMDMKTYTAKNDIYLIIALLSFCAFVPIISNICIRICNAISEIIHYVHGGYAED